MTEFVRALSQATVAPTLSGADGDQDRTYVPELWAVVLAGGNGQRVKSLTQKLTGYPCPKQYCTFVGHRSMIQCTVARAEWLAPPARVVVVAAEDHRKEVYQQLADRPARTILLQPQNRETGPGVLLPLIWITRRDPGAVVVVLPSDHFILEEAAFMAHVRHAGQLVREGPDLCILLGVDPEAPETAYGWIEPFPEADGGGLFPIKGFYEKPDRLMAEQLCRAGCLWNTLVIVARAQAILRMYEKHLPDLYDRFRRIAPLFGTARQEDALIEAYAAMPAVTISRGLLERNPANLRVLRVPGVLWSDWGSAARICQTLERIGRIQELAWHLARRGHDPRQVLREVA